MNLDEQPLPVLFLVLAVAAIMVWYSGSKVTRYVDTIARRTGIGQAFAGMLILGGVTTLPEMATASTAAAQGNALLAVNDLLGSTSVNLVLLAVGDFLYGRDALTSVAGRPVTLMQGSVGMMLLAGVAFSVAIADTPVPLIGAGVATLVLAAACMQALRISYRFERAKTWQLMPPVDDDDDAAPDDVNASTTLLAGLAAMAALTILLGGATLATVGDAIAERADLGSSIVGFTLLGFSTSLPEFSTVFAALRIRRYQLAIGDIFGAILFNILILFIADLFYREGALLNAAGTFEIAASCLAAVLTGIFLVGLLERRNRTVGRIGTDSALVLFAYLGGLVALSRI